MIGNAVTGASFAGLARYLTEGGEDRVAHVEAWNTFESDPMEVAKEMSDAAGLSSRVEKPVYHLSISFPVEDETTRDERLDVMREVLEDLGLADHHVFVAEHRDKAHPHVHAMVNRVQHRRRAEDCGKAWSTENDWEKIERSLRRIEQERGWRRVPGFHGRPEGEKKPAPAMSTGEVRMLEGEGRDKAFAKLVSELSGPDFEEAGSWEELEKRLARKGLWIQGTDRGGVVTDGEERCKLSRVGRDYSRQRLSLRFREDYWDYREQSPEKPKKGALMQAAKVEQRAYDETRSRLEEGRIDPRLNELEKTERKVDLINGLLEKQLETQLEREIERAEISDVEEAALQERGRLRARHRWLEQGRAVKTSDLSMSYAERVSRKSVKPVQKSPERPEPEGDEESSQQTPRSDPKAPLAESSSAESSSAVESSSAAEPPSAEESSAESGEEEEEETEVSLPENPRITEEELGPSVELASRVDEEGNVYTPLDEGRDVMLVKTRYASKEKIREELEQEDRLKEKKRPLEKKLRWRASEMAALEKKRTSFAEQATEASSWETFEKLYRLREQVILVAGSLRSEADHLKGKIGRLEEKLQALREKGQYQGKERFEVKSTPVLQDLFRRLDVAQKNRLQKLETLVEEARRRALQIAEEVAREYRLVREGNVDGIDEHREPVRSKRREQRLTEKRIGRTWEGMRAQEKALQEAEEVLRDRGAFGPREKARRFEHLKRQLEIAEMLPGLEEARLQASELEADLMRRIDREKKLDWQEEVLGFKADRRAESAERLKRRAAEHAAELEEQADTLRRTLLEEKVTQLPGREFPEPSQIIKEQVIEDLRKVTRLSEASEEAFKALYEENTGIESTLNKEQTRIHPADIRSRAEAAQAARHRFLERAYLQGTSPETRSYRTAEKSLLFEPEVFGTVSDRIDDHSSNRSAKGVEASGVSDDSAFADDPTLADESTFGDDSAEVSAQNESAQDNSSQSDEDLLSRARRAKEAERAFAEARKTFRETYGTDPKDFASAAPTEELRKSLGDMPDASPLSPVLRRVVAGSLKRRAENELERLAGRFQEELARKYQSSEQALRAYRANRNEHGSEVARDVLRNPRFYKEKEQSFVLPGKQKPAEEQNAEEVNRGLATLARRIRVEERKIYSYSQIERNARYQVESALSAMKSRRGVSEIMPRSKPVHQPRKQVGEAHSTGENHPTEGNSPIGEKSRWGTGGEVGPAGEAWGRIAEAVQESLPALEAQETCGFQEEAQHRRKVRRVVGQIEKVENTSFGREQVSDLEAVLSENIDGELGMEEALKDVVSHQKAAAEIVTENAGPGASDELNKAAKTIQRLQEPNEKESQEVLEGLQVIEAGLEEDNEILLQVGRVRMNKDLEKERGEAILKMKHRKRRGRRARREAPTQEGDVEKVWDRVDTMSERSRSILERRARRDEAAEKALRAAARREKKRGGTRRGPTPTKNRRPDSTTERKQDREDQDTDPKDTDREETGQEDTGQEDDDRGFGHSRERDKGIDL